jgi:Gas vesicle protein
MERVPTVSGTANLLDILDRVLDKGLVIAGDVRISLANVELLTIRIRLLVCSVDKAEEIGLNWWKFDPNLTHPAGLPEAQRRRLPRAGPGVELPAATTARKTAVKVSRKNRKKNAKTQARG